MRKPNKWHKGVVFLIASSRHEAKLTQEELAKKLGWSRAKVCKIESGERRIDVPEFIEIAFALDMPPEQLFARVIQWVNCVEAWKNGKPFHPK